LARRDVAAYTLYDVIRHLASQARWPTDHDRIAALASVDEAEALAVLGTSAHNIECPHSTVLDSGRCEDCGRTIVLRDPPRPTSPQRYVRGG
jgi:hypothetical protein